jgi:oligoendopeptidase F
LYRQTSVRKGKKVQINNAVRLLNGLDWSGRRLAWLDRKQRAQEHEQTLSEPNNTELQ